MPRPFSAMPKQCIELIGNLRKNVKFQFFGDKMEKKHFIFIIGMKFGVSKKMRPYDTLLNIFSEIALIEIPLQGMTF